MSRDMKKILCAVDDSDHSQTAARFAGELAAVSGANLTLLAVNEMIGGYTRADASARLWNAAQLNRLLDKAAATARAAGAPHVTHTIDSRDVARAIAQHAEDEEFDHIVIGAGGKSAIEHLMLGSVSSDVVTRAPCPVTIARWSLVC